MTDLKGKTALVTGSTSGIGKATAIALPARGAHVLGVGRNDARQTAKEHEGEVIAAGNWEVLHGDGSVRGIAMDARFSLLDGIPTPTQHDGASA